MKKGGAFRVGGGGGGGWVMMGCILAAFFVRLLDLGKNLRVDNLQSLFFLRVWIRRMKTKVVHDWYSLFFIFYLCVLMCFICHFYIETLDRTEDEYCLHSGSY